MWYFLKSCNSIYIKNLIKFLKFQRKIRKHCHNFFRQISLGWMNKPVEIILEKYLKLNSFSLQFKARTHHCVKVSVFGVFLVRIFPHLDWIRRDTPYLSVFSPYAGLYGREKLWIRTLFTQCITEDKFVKKIISSSLLKEELFL